jgi:hypothetical protein
VKTPQIPLIKGDKATNGVWGDALPFNMIAVKDDILGASGYMTQFNGIDTLASAKRYLRANTASSYISIPKIQVSTEYEIEVNFCQFSNSTYQVILSNLTAFSLGINTDGSIKISCDYKDDIVSPASAFNLGELNTIKIVGTPGSYDATIYLNGSVLMSGEIAPVPSITNIGSYNGSSQFNGVISDLIVTGSIDIDEPINIYAIDDNSDTIKDSAGSKNGTVTGGNNDDWGYFSVLEDSVQGSGLSVPPWLSVDQVINVAGGSVSTPVCRGALWAENPELKGSYFVIGNVLYSLSGNDIVSIGTMTGSTADRAVIFETFNNIVIISDYNLWYYSKEAGLRKINTFSVIGTSEIGRLRTGIPWSSEVITHFGLNANGGTNYTESAQILDGGTAITLKNDMDIGDFPFFSPAWNAAFWVDHSLSPGISEKYLVAYDKDSTRGFPIYNNSTAKQWTTCVQYNPTSQKWESFINGNVVNQFTNDSDIVLIGVVRTNYGDDGLYAENMELFENTLTLDEGITYFENENFIGKPIDGTLTNGYVILTDGTTVNHSSISNEEAFPQLAYASAEFSPDSIKGLGSTTNSELLVFGDRTKQVFRNIGGSQPFKFQVSKAMTERVGIAGTHVKKYINNRWYAITSRENASYKLSILGDTGEQVISTLSINKALSNMNYADDIENKAYIEAFDDGSGEYVIFNFPSINKSYLFNSSAAQHFGADNAWSILSKDNENYRAVGIIRNQDDGKTICGDHKDSTIGHINADTPKIYGESPEWKIYTPLVKLDSGIINSITVDTLPGQESSRGGENLYLYKTVNGYTYDEFATVLYNSYGVDGVRFYTYQCGYVNNYIGFEIKGQNLYKVSLSNMTMDVS